ncbi:MAG: 30S ribosomal protein S19e [Candidatus Bathyarchaeia archaeon]
MTTPYDVPAAKFVGKLARYLKENIEVVQPPLWANVVKTGSHVEKQPQDADWWYTRSASVLRKIYLHGPIGLEELRADYGGRKSCGTKPSHASKAGGCHLRKILQQLQQAGLIEVVPAQGRRMTPKGRKLLQEIALDLHRDLVKVVPALRKYQGE